MSGTYTYREYPLVSGGRTLHLDCVSAAGTRPEKSILLLHGVTYSSHVFDVDYKDYSLVRLLAREGWAVWRLDMPGYGRSAPVEDGFLPDSRCAADCISGAAERIAAETGQEQLDLLGWSWGTVTAGRFAARRPARLRRLVLYAPILTGIGREEISEPFHRNTPAHAAEDFQKLPDGSFDPAAAERTVIERYCSSCLRCDGERSPNGGRREICVGRDRDLIELERIAVPTLIICGDRDPYLNAARLADSPARLPEGSALCVVPGAGHILMLEAPYYHRFQETVLSFLKK